MTTKRTSDKLYSWTIINDTTAIKKCDKSFFDHRGSAIPEGLKWFFCLDNTEYGDRQELTIQYLGTTFNGRTETDQLRRCRIFWHTNLANLFRRYQPKEDEEYPHVRFSRINSTTYEISFLNEEIIEKEKDNPFESEYVPKTEGQRKQYYTSKYERNPENRKQAIRIHGTRCMICGFDFEAVYGEAGRNFIEVHHIKPLSEAKQEVQIDPEKDLICVCSNCHRIIHRKKNGVYNIEEVKNMLNR